jgi:tetratricopeptide (TPR) repeat protein
MKKAVFILAIIVFSILYYMGVMTKKETLPFSKDFFTVETPATEQPIDIKEVWPLKGRSSGQKVPTLSSKELDQLYQLKLDRGLRNIPLLSFFLIREAQQARYAGDHDLSVRLANSSIKFSPDLFTPYFELAKARWHQNTFQFDKIIPSFLDGLIALTSYFSSSLNFYYNVFYILANAILLTFMLFGIVVLVKYFPLFVYDIRKDLTQEITKVVLNGLRIFVLFIPFFLRLDMLWAILYWNVLLWGYLPKKERQFLLCFFIVLVYLPYALRSASSYLESPSSDILLEMNRANYEDWDGTTELKLQTWLTAHPDDTDVLFTLGLMEKKQGRYDQAEKYYQGALQKEPTFSEAQSNLGNVYMARKEVDLAIAAYEKAVSIDPGKAAYYFNLYRAYSQKTLLSGKLDLALQKARQLDPKLVDFYLSVDTSRQAPVIQRFLIDESLRPDRFWGRVWAHFIGREGVLFHVFRAWFERIPSRISFLSAFFFLVFVAGMSRYSRAKRFLTRCPMCGSPTHRFYLGASDQEFICFNCNRMFVQREKLHPTIVEKKALQVKVFQKESRGIGIFVSHFIVGFGYVWRGSFVRGLLLTFLFFVFVMRFVHWNGVLMHSWVQSPPSLWTWVLWGGLFVLIYLISLRQIYRLKPRFRARP